MLLLTEEIAMLGCVVQHCKGLSLEEQAFRAYSQAFNHGATRARWVEVILLNKEEGRGL